MNEAAAWPLGSCRIWTVVADEFESLGRSKLHAIDENHPESLLSGAQVASHENISC